jgi:hypothetical protein
MIGTVVATPTTVDVVSGVSCTGSRTSTSTPPRTASAVRAVWVTTARVEP